MKGGKERRKYKRRQIISRNSLSDGIIEVFNANERIKVSFPRAVMQDLLKAGIRRVRRKLVK